ncbi:MAG: response regulator, partial [Myxococcales bacterium]|nr:response regulator [Myxococcales bacterium]
GQLVEVLVPESARAVHVEHRTEFTGAARTRSMGAGRDLLGRRKDGSCFPIQVSLRNLELDDGRHVIAAIRDISEAVQARRAAQLAADHLRNAVECIEDAFAVFDPEGRLVTHNSAFQRLYEGVLAGPLIGRSVAELARAVAVAEGLDAAQQEALVQQRVGLVTQPASVGRLERLGRVYRVVSRRTQDGGAVVVTSDRTEELQREEALRKASAAKSDFLSSMSHELRTPLNAVLGFAQLLRRDRKTPLTERQSGMVDHVVAGGEHLLHLIDDVLDLTRIEAGTVPFSIEPVDVASTVAQAVTTLAPMAARAEVELVVDPSVAAVGAVTADRTRLAQVLMNYGSNAIKYGRKGGRAVVRASLQASDRVRLEVLDDGPGIPEDQQQRLFEPFFRAGQESGPIEGTGIGLAISRRLVETMGGSVGFRSRPGAGSEFWVELAVSGEVAPQVPAGSAGRLSAAGGPARTIVYIEDQPTNIAFMQALMADVERIELVTAPTAEIGVELIRARRPAVVILDINLPGMSGLEAVRVLKSWPETRDIPVIALSAAAMERDVRRGVEAGFYRYLTKPIQVDELLATLEQLLSGPPAPS